MADWNQLMQITDSNQFLDEANKLLYGAPTSMPTQQGYYQSLVTPQDTPDGPVWGQDASYFNKGDALNPSYMSFDEMMATKGTDRVSAAPMLEDDYVSPYTRFQNAWNTYMNGTPGVGGEPGDPGHMPNYSGYGYINTATGDNPALSGAGLKYSSDPAVMAQNAIAPFMMDTMGFAPGQAYVNLTNRLPGLPTEVLDRIVKEAGTNLSGYNMAVQDYPTIGQGYDLRNKMLQLDRRSREGGGFEEIMNQVTRFVPGIAEARMALEPTASGQHTGLDSMLDVSRALIGGYVDASGRQVSRDLGRVIPDEYNGAISTLAPIIGMLIKGPAGLIAANDIANEVTGKYMEDPTGATLGSAVKGGTAFAMSGLADALGGLSEADLTSAINQADAIRGFGEVAGEVPKAISKEAWDAMYGGIENGTILGDLQSTGADILGDFAQYIKPNKAEMEWITDTSNFPGINTPENMPNMTEEQLLANEAERDAIAQQMNPPKDTYYFNSIKEATTPTITPLGIDKPPDDRYFDPISRDYYPNVEGEGGGDYVSIGEDNAMTGSMSNEQMDQLLQQGMSEAPSGQWNSDFDWNKLMKDLMSMFKGIVSMFKGIGGSNAGAVSPEAVFSNWGGRRIGGGVEGEGGYIPNERMGKLGRSRAEASPFDSGEFDINQLLAAGLKDYFIPDILKDTLKG